MKTLLEKEEQKELSVLDDLLKELTQEEQQELIIFIQGVRFAKRFEKEKAPA